MSELFKSAMTTLILLHATYLTLVILLFVNMRKSFHRSHRRKELPIDCVYGGCALTIITDCLWTVLTSICVPETAIAYIINLLYFIGSSFASVCWLLFCLNHLDLKLADRKWFRVCLLVLYDIMLFLYIYSPAFGFIFRIENGQYVRGTLFFLDPIVKMGYIALASFLAILSGRKKELPYLRKQDFHFALFGVPTLICGILQVIFGSNFNCLGMTAALIMIYLIGITNSDSENTDAIYSLANSFDASYIVNMDT